MKLVANVIVHNEAIYLPVIIPSLQMFADRIIFVDQASTDNSVELIQANLRPQDKILYNYDNILDLSISRNKMMEYCNDGDWIFKWDADELPSDQMIDGLHDLISKRDEVGWGVPCYHIMKEPNQCLPIEFGFHHMCLYKKTSKTVWMDAVHSHIEGIEGPTGNIPVDTGISIIHFSYFAEKRFRKKAEFYAKLPGSGFTNPMHLIQRLSLTPMTLPSYVSYRAPTEWLEKLRTAP